MLLACLLAGCARRGPVTPVTRPTSELSRLVEEYLEGYFTTFPSEATAAGRHDLDDRLEVLDAEVRRDWLAYNRVTVSRLEQLQSETLRFDDSLDAEVLLRRARLFVFDWGIRARALDVRVHTQGMTRDQVLELVQGEALQDAHFASNLWTRAITTPAQITSYWTGYQQIWEVYEEAKADRGQDFELRQFTDGMTALGPVPVRHYRSRSREGASAVSSPTSSPMSSQMLE